MDSLSPQFPHQRPLICHGNPDFMSFAQLFQETPQIFLRTLKHCEILTIHSKKKRFFFLVVVDPRGSGRTSRFGFSRAQLCTSVRLEDADADAVVRPSIVAT